MRGRGGVLAVAALLAACGGSPERAPRDNARSIAHDSAAVPRPSETASPEPAPSPSPSVAAPSPTPVKLASYPPRDECAKLPGFAAFRKTLFDAVRARDAAALGALADPKVQLDFGGGAGPDELRKRLSETRPELWGELAALTSLGCAADGGVATLPSIFARVPETIDPYRTMWVTGEGVPLRAKASTGAAGRARLGWALVELVGASFDPKAAFTEVRTADGARGFVAGERLRSVLDYRLIADREGDTWKITAFIAGD
ncbi:MAG TPA: hypothetical protein VM055_06470 [Novosphingobium sp.]|nr:hypothetical protein [Novosphingobium sp.]